jgi:hypothetical protein
MQTVHILQLDSADTELLPKEQFLQGIPVLLLLFLLKKISH